MFDEAKAKKDLERMRRAYKEAMERFDEIEERQKQIAKMLSSEDKENKN